MMKNSTDILGCIAAAPLDKTSWLVLADSLEEDGHDELAAAARWFAKELRPWPMFGIGTRLLCLITQDHEPAWYWPIVDLPAFIDVTDNVEKILFPVFTDITVAHEVMADIVQRHIEASLKTAAARLP